MSRKQLSLLGCRTFSNNGPADCARFVARRNLDVDSPFTHSWPSSEAEKAQELFDTQTTG